MVNTHKKFPTDAKHNAYYEADGSDLRDATSEERQMYRLAAPHKRKKPEAESSCGKSWTAAALENKSRVKETRNSDSRRRDVETPHDRYEQETHRRRPEDKSGRTSSRDSAKGHGTTHQDRCGTGGSRREEDSGHEKRTGQSGNQADADGVDDDERDRLEVAEIVQRMGERKTAKELEVSRLSRKKTKSEDAVVDVSHGKNERVVSDVAKTTNKIVADSQKATKKASAARTTTTGAHTTQREAARI